MVITLILIGFLAGLVTGISPCILPVLPVIFAAGAASGLEDPIPGSTTPVAEGPTRSADERSGEGRRRRGPSRRGRGHRGPAPGRWRRRSGRVRRRRRPLAVVAGLVVSFAIVTLIGSWLLSALGLPQDLLRTIGLVVLGLVGLGLLVPAVGEWLERPFARLARGRSTVRGRRVRPGAEPGPGLRPRVRAPC